MSRVLCTVDHMPRVAAESVRAAIERCRERGAELTLMGVVEPYSSAPSPAYGESVRRFGLTQGNLVRAARAARAAGLAPTVELRMGRHSSSTLAREAGADEIVTAEPRGRLRRGYDVVVVPAPRRLELVDDRRELAAA